MPSRRTKALGDGSIIICHEFIPLIQASVYIAVGLIVIVTVFFIYTVVGLFSVTLYGVTIIQILLHPTLGSKLYSGIDLVIADIGEVLTAVERRGCLYDNRLRFGICAGERVLIEIRYGFCTNTCS